MQIKKIGIIGLGTIGRKLCEYLSEKGFIVYAYNYRNIKHKEKEINKNIEKKVKYNKISYHEFENIIKRISFVDDLKELNNVDLIIDSSVESYEIKKTIYQKLSKIGIKRPIGCTTSSLDIIKISENYYKNFLFGLHFFNPPTKMKLVELCFLKENSVKFRNKIFSFLNHLDDKVIIELPIIQGYIVNRILFVYINYAIKFMNENNLEPKIIDKPMKLGTNVPMGTLEL